MHSDTKTGLVREIVETIVLALCTIILGTVGAKVLSHEKQLTAHSTMLDMNSGRLHDLEQYGSRSLEAYAKADAEVNKAISARIEKLEQGMLLLVPLPERMNGIAASQARIERLLEAHVQIEKGVKQ